MNELVTTKQMRALESAALARGIPEEVLMEQAGKGLAELLAPRLAKGVTLVIFAGKGHNAGDAFVAARVLEEMHPCQIQLRLVHPQEVMKPLALEKFQQLRTCQIVPVDAPVPHGRSVLLDAMLGIGFTGELADPVKHACQVMNRWRETHFTDVVAVDVPTGLGAAGGVIADCTVTLGAPKVDLVADAVTSCVGRIVLIPLSGLNAPSAGDFVITPAWVRHTLPRKRDFDTHKGHSGRVGIVAGGPGCIGAARLSSAAAVKAGAGLVTLFVPEKLYPIAAASVIPEVMVRTFAEIRSTEADAWGIGPGLGQTILPEIADWMRVLNKPAVVDADALNWSSKTGLCALETPEGPRLLTPHPGEMNRLLAAWKPEFVGKPRARQAAEFAHAFGVALLLKGSRTILAQRGKPLAYNSTGTPAMATGGMGDVLTGICAALISQGLDTYSAGGVGSWLLGRAGELAAPQGLGAGLLLDYLQAARQCAIDGIAW